MMEKVILFGTSEGSKLIYETLSEFSTFEVVAFTIDGQYLQEDTFCGLPVVPFEKVESIYPPDSYKMFIAILANEMNKLRETKYNQAKQKGYSFINFIHPSAIVYKSVTMGDNCFLFEGVMARPHLKIGNGVIIMSCAFLGHYSLINDFCYIGANATLLGAVKVEPNSIIGPNSTIMEELIIKRETLVGAGCVISKNTNEKEVYRAPAPTVLPLTSDKLAKFIFRERKQL